MRDDKNNVFEDSLQDILTSEDPKTSPHTSPPIKEKNRFKATRPDNQQHFPEKIPSWIETVIRILAAITILVLLLLFGLQVASR